MSYRAKKYVDSTNPLIKRSGPQFTITYDFPYARQALLTPMATVRSLLQSERRQNTRYNQVWNHATAMFNQKKNILRAQSKKPLPDECHIAIIAYTAEQPLSNGTTLEVYVDFNKKCRELTDASSWARFPYKSLYCLLAQAISAVQSNPDNNKPPYYRGVTFHYDPNFPNDQIVVDFSQFTSFTQKREVAVNFIKSKGGKGTLLMLPYPPMAGIGIKNYSDFASEEEVLVCPWSTFSVAFAKTEGNIHEIVLQSEGPYFEHFPYTVAKQKPLSFFNLFG